MARPIGIVLQKLHLISSLDVEHNLLLAQYLAGAKQEPARAAQVLAGVGLADRAHARPHQLSHGQEQRVAVARAVMNRPQLLIADEPTSNLDDAHCAAALDLLEAQAAECGATLVVATHDARVKPRFERRWSSAMNLPGISLAYLRAKPLSTALNLLLLALGIATITVLMLATQQIEERMGRDARGIDLVVGAKGSPMQLVLSAVFHLDAPTGNIPLDDAMALAKHRLVKRAIPLALGDSYKGFRIVGDQSRLRRPLRRAARGRQPLGETHGGGARRRSRARVRPARGREVRRRARPGRGRRGARGGAIPVVGVLAPTGTVIDRVVLTSVESVWEVHEHGKPAGGAREITALLIQYASPLAAATLPRAVNAGAAAGCLARLRERAPVPHARRGRGSAARLRPRPGARRRPLGVHRAHQRARGAALRPRGDAHARRLAREAHGPAADRRRWCCRRPARCSASRSATC